MKRKRQTRPKRLLKRARSGGNRRQTVRRLTAQGYSGDVVAALVGMNKNALRSQHAIDLEHGREIARADAAAAEAEQLSAEEETMRRAFFAGYGSHWEQPDGYNLLQDCKLPESKKRWAEWLRRHRRGESIPSATNSAFED